MIGGFGDYLLLYMEILQRMGMEEVQREDVNMGEGVDKFRIIVLLLWVCVISWYLNWSGFVYVLEWEIYEILVVVCGYREEKG